MTHDDRSDASMIAAEISDAKDVESAPSKVDGDAAAVYPWAQLFHEFRSDHMPSTGEPANEQERIACLEIIVAILIEKNERFRRQLFQRSATEK